MLNKHFREFIELLARHEVRYLVVGGYAVAVHGFPRYTGDIDFFVAVSPENAKKLADVFDAFGFGDIGLAPADFLETDTVVEIGREPNKIQVLTGIDGVTFEQCYESRVVVELDGLGVNVISLEDLLRNKKAAPRTKDKLDLEELLRVRQSKSP